MLAFYCIGIVLLPILDQLAKWLVCKYIPYRASVPVIGNIFSLTYIKNTGAGMGILDGQYWLFLLIAAVVVVGATAYMFKKRPKHLGLNIAITLLVGGAVGNCIDRIARGYVVDYLDFSGLYFPYIFNLADCFVVVGSILFAIYIVFWDKPTPGETPTESKPETE